MGMSSGVRCRRLRGEHAYPRDAMAILAKVSLLQWPIVYMVMVTASSSSSPPPYGMRRRR